MQLDTIQLESRVEQLEFENAALKQKIAVHIKERAVLQQKQQRTSKLMRELAQQLKTVYCD